jgi:cytochrome c oxidase subunit 2
VFVLSERTYGLIPRAARAATPAAPRTAGDSMPTIEVTGRQWWWQIRYRPANGAGGFTTANEIHLPVDRPVRILIHSVDVNHSFWIPQLHPKEDAIPDRVNTIVVRADRPGTYRGECSEFCGQEHARMAFTVVAESPERYAEWVARQSQDARTPSDTVAARGQAAFLENACAFCHSIRGTSAAGAVAPDLTHIASRSTLAAGTVPNTSQMLGGWIMNAPAMKPGTQMPAFPQLDAPTLRGLIAYLGTLR